MGSWSFGQRIGAGFAAVVVIAVAMAALSLFSTQAVLNSNTKLVAVFGENLIDTNRLATFEARRAVAIRGFLLSGTPFHLQRITEARTNFETTMARLQSRVQTSDEKQLLDRCEALFREHQSLADRIMEMKRRGESATVVSREFETLLVPKRTEVMNAINSLEDLQTQLRERYREDTVAAATQARRTMFVSLGILVLVAAGLGVTLTTTLKRQIGSAVGQVQSSSAELQTVANQQAAGMKEQSTAMTEIATTITELLSTSRQISESAQQVAAIAERTARAAGTGDAILDKSTSALDGIRQQVDGIVNQVLDLGKKSQQIGQVIDILAELAEQTNILAINAGIEAAGAGEAGRRFGVVAEEIRKLADRVYSSTRETRTLVNDVRDSVHTTVMLTETGSKAVEAGTRQFSEAATSFRDIVNMVGTTTEATREIELSTKQQSSAVEQVNVAIANILQASRENEASTSQTLQTAAQLASLSSELLQMVTAR